MKRMVLSIIVISTFFLAGCFSSGGGGGGGVGPSSGLNASTVLSNHSLTSIGTDDTFEAMMGISGSSQSGVIDIGNGYTLEKGSLQLIRNGEVLFTASSMEKFEFEGQSFVMSINAPHTKLDNEGYPYTGQDVFMLASMNHSNFGLWSIYEPDFNAPTSTDIDNSHYAFHNPLDGDMALIQTAPSSGNFTGIAMAVVQYNDDAAGIERGGYLLGDAVLNVTSASAGSLDLNFDRYATLTGSLNFATPANSRFTNVVMADGYQNVLNVDLGVIPLTPGAPNTQNRIDAQFYGASAAEEAAGTFRLQHSAQPTPGNHVNTSINGAFGVR